MNWTPSVQSPFFFVISNHWFPQTHIINAATRGQIGPIGVDIFFVLSGFLITRIVLTHKQEIEQGKLDEQSVLKTFFFRRVIRIFPIYYLTLFILYGFVDTFDRQSILYYLTYTANYSIYMTQTWGVSTHLWSLAVEEQFYIVWPLVLLMTKTRYLLPTIIFFIATGVGTHIVLGRSDFTAILTFTCFDALGSGALLAWMTIYRPNRMPALSRWLTVLTPVSLLLLALSFYREQWIGLPQRTLVAVVTVGGIATIFLAQQKGKTVLPVVFKNPVLLFTGKISYGIYLYHNIIPYFTNDYLTAANRHLPASVFQFNQYVLVAENLLIVFLVAFLSWKLIEQPLLGLKKRFDYRQHTRAVEIA